MKTVLKVEDERLAVLYALQDVDSATAHEIFGHLPLQLRQRWEEKFLVHAILYDLIDLGFVQTRQAAPGRIEYALTRKGQLEL